MDVDVPNILKRCLSAPIINDLPSNSNLPTSKQTRSVDEMTSTTAPPTPSASSSREASPAPTLNIFAPRARRYSASFASLGAGNGPRLTPRVSQLRQEECVDANAREVNHEREVHSAMQISHSWEDLTLVAENWSCKSDDLTNPLQVTLPSGPPSCSSPSPTSSRAGMRLPYGLSPSPTRKIFTRRSMSPIAMRPSQLGPVKRKFELDDSNWTNTCSPPPLKKIFTESRGPSPICQSPSSVCPSPDSGTYEGRLTPKLFVARLYSNGTNSTSSMCSSPMIPSPGVDSAIDLTSNNNSSPATTLSSSGGNEPMSITSCCDNETESEMTDTESESRPKMGMDSDSETTTDSLREKKSATHNMNVFEETIKNEESGQIDQHLDSNRSLLSTIVAGEKMVTNKMPTSSSSTDSLSSFSGSSFRISCNTDSGDNSISNNTDSVESNSNYESEIVDTIDNSV